MSRKKERDLSKKKKATKKGDERKKERKNFDTEGDDDDDDDDEQLQLYIGPKCSTNGRRIHIGLFTDEDCSVKYDMPEHYTTADYTGFQFWYGILSETYDHSSTSTSSECMSCAEEKDEDDDGNDWKCFWPSYASTLVIELVRTKEAKGDIDDTHFLRIIMNGKPVRLVAMRNKPDKDLGLSDFSAIIDGLEKIYCGTLGIEYNYISSLSERTWFQQRLEPNLGKLNFNANEKNKNHGCVSFGFCVNRNNCSRAAGSKFYIS